MVATMNNFWMTAGRIDRPTPSERSKKHVQPSRFTDTDGSSTSEFLAVQVLNGRATEFYGSV